MFPAWQTSSTASLTKWLLAILCAAGVQMVPLVVNNQGSAKIGVSSIAVIATVVAVIVVTVLIVVVAAVLSSSLLSSL
jgi:hypothetical protein